MIFRTEVSRQCYKISRNVGNWIEFYFSATKHVFGMNPICFWCESERYVGLGITDEAP